MPNMRVRKQRDLPDLWQVAFDDERRIVASCLLSPKVVSKCGALAPTHFTNSVCRSVWSVMSEFHKLGIPWDFSTVASELARQGTAEPEAALARLTEGAVETIGIERAVANVRAMSLRCRLVKEVDSLQRSLQDPANELSQTLKATLRKIESFADQYMYIDLGIELDGPNLGTSNAVGGQVLDEMADFVQRFVILTKSELLVISLWIAHTWAFEACDATPYLAVTSPEKRSGKTRLLEILAFLVRGPWLTGRVTAAALARKIESDCPTLLLDEWDATARGNQEFAETLRGILNSGHRRDGRVSVCGPRSAGYQPTDFSVFCPKVISGIGKLPETIADRSIPIRLKRKAPGEKVDRFRAKLVSGVANSLKERLRSWVSTRLQDLKDARPELPECLSDRQQDGAEPLLAIADAAGGDWPFRARAALRDLYSANNAADESVAVMLLSDIRDIFFERNADSVASKGLAEALGKIEGRPWPTWDHHRPFTPNSLARLLAPFDIFPRNLRIGRLVAKGYQRRWFSDSWTRYLPPLSVPIPGPSGVTPLQPARDTTDVEFGKKLSGADVAVLPTAIGRHCSDVAVDGSHEVPWE